MKKLLPGSFVYWGICLAGIGVVFLLQERIPAASLTIIGLVIMAAGIMATTAVDRWVVTHRK